METVNDIGKWMLRLFEKWLDIFDIKYDYLRYSMTKISLSFEYKLYA